jgi:hypothetical protein
MTEFEFVFSLFGLLLGLSLIVSVRRARLIVRYVVQYLT